MKAKSLFDYHKEKIAKNTLKLSDAGVLILGGMSKEEARNFLKSLGYSTQQISKIEE